MLVEAFEVTKGRVFKYDGTLYKVVRDYDGQNMEVVVIARFGDFNDRINDQPVKIWVGIRPESYWNQFFNPYLKVDIGF